MSSLPRFIFSIFFTVTLLFAGNVLAQTATAPSTGDGTSGNPFQIATLNNLYWITQNGSSWGSYFVQTADIDASGSSLWDSGAGFSPIGIYGSSPFTGSYDGQGHRITGLYINRPSTNYVGFFGYTNGTLKNIKLVNVNITGYNNVGGLIGIEISSTVTSCCSNGSVTGKGSYYVGGLIGYQSNYSTVSNCYSGGSVTGYGSYTGGLIGVQCGYSPISATNCYSTDSVTGINAGANVGGLIGCQSGYFGAPTATNCYSAGFVTGTSSVGGLIGVIQFGVTVTNCFWDMTSSGQASSAGGTGESTTLMKTQSTFTDAGWDFTTVWAISSGINNGYPYLMTDLPLAVQATSFSAQADFESVILTWKTQSEVNNAGFNVLRQDPSTTSGSTSLTTGFKLIASYTSNDNLKGMGTSTSGRSYNFTDTKVKSGLTYQYKIQSVSTDGTTKDLTTLTVTVDIPKSYALYQNYPNPFNPSTTIRFDLKQTSTVTLEVFNVLGQRVEYWNYGTMDAGRYNENVNMDRFASGVYYYKISAFGNSAQGGSASGGDGQKFVSMKKLLMIK